MRERVSCHAEIDAMKRCDPRGTILYVARMGRNGLVAMSKPCSRCEDAMRAEGVKRVVYTIGPNEFGSITL